jgi:hypothetical protein
LIVAVRLLVVLFAAFLGGCVTNAGFTCQSDQQCGKGGVCERTDFCSFADDSCMSGRRYGSEASTGLKNKCVTGNTDAGPTPDSPIAVPDAPPGTPDAPLAAVADARRGPADARKTVDAPRPDANNGAAPVPRLVSEAYYSNYSGLFFSPAGMTATGFEIPTTGVHDGDLLLFIASIDNGSPTLWPNPIAPGFTQLVQAMYGNDGETYVVQYKFASGEPIKYTGTYGASTSGSAVLMLVAVTGVDPANPIDGFATGHFTGAGTAPVIGTSTGVTPGYANTIVVFASGVDWESYPGSNTFVFPSGYTPIASLGDHGDDTWDWTSQQISYEVRPTPGATGPITAEFDENEREDAGTAIVGTAWTVGVGLKAAP